MEKQRSRRNPNIYNYSLAYENIKDLRLPQSAPQIQNAYLTVSSRIRAEHHINGPTRRSTALHVHRIILHGLIPLAPCWAIARLVLEASLDVIERSCMIVLISIASRRVQNTIPHLGSASAPPDHAQFDATFASLDDLYSHTLPQ